MSIRVVLHHRHISTCIQSHLLLSRTFHVCNGELAGFAEKFNMTSHFLNLTPSTRQGINLHGKASQEYSSASAVALVCILETLNFSQANANIGMQHQAFGGPQKLFSYLDDQTNDSRIVASLDQRIANSGQRCGLRKPRLRLLSNRPRQFETQHRAGFESPPRQGKEELKICHRTLAASGFDVLQIGRKRV
jgi:hypothetical protein